MRMILNLLSNSLKFTRRGGSITLSYEMDGDGRPVIRVRDTGVGMTAGDVTVALAEYGQVPGDIVQEHEGTGIGLPFVKQMIEEHGGHLEITSAPSEGTAVALIFPAQAARYPRPNLVVVK